jgi:hypothetical protein
MDKPDLATAFRYVMPNRRQFDWSAARKIGPGRARAATWA